MLSSVEQAFVRRDEKRAPLKTPACEARSALKRKESGVLLYLLAFSPLILYLSSTSLLSLV